jgi:hypothetical protein
LVEKDKLGGTCLNRGCIQTSVFARAMAFREMGAKSKDYGILFKEQSVDFSKPAARKDVVIKTLVGGVAMLLKQHGVETEQGIAAFLSGRSDAVRGKHAGNSVSFLRKDAHHGQDGRQINNRRPRYRTARMESREENVRSPAAGKGIQKTDKTRRPTWWDR